MMKKRHILHWAMGVVMTPLLGSCAFDELHEIAGGGNGVLSFGVEVNAGAPEVKPMGGATRSGDRADSSATGNAVMSPDVDGFFPTSSVELSSVDGKTLYANCDERSGINMHNNVDYKATRGSVIETSSFYNSFALYGYVYDSGSSFTNSTTVNSSINGIQMSKNGSGSEYKASTVYWPGASKKATFFAVAPKDCSGASITANSGDPQITYTVPQEVSNQEDFLLAVAKDVICDGKNAPSLAFNHALAAIKFEEGTLTGYSSISKVEISGVKNKGTLSSFETPSWTGQEINESGANTYTISDLSNVMFLMPQTTPDGAKLKVTFSDGTNSKAFEADLNGTSWQAGHQYTYKLSVNKVTGTFHFEVSPSTVSIGIAGGTQTFTVKSYFKYTDGTIKPIPWIGSYTIGTTTTPLNGDGGDSGDTFIMTIDDNSSTTGDDSHTTELQSRTDINTFSRYTPYNLSNPTGASKVVNTANCYVVGRKGKYSIPLVYGCAIKDGAKNENAYGKGTYNNKTLSTSTFKTHNDEPISDPYIYNNPSSGTKYAPNKAELLWQDWSGLISSVLYNPSTQMIEFEIGDGIHQGNAIIAIKDASDVVLWSWHIWVTDRDICATVQIKCNDGTSNIYNFMQVPLGWCDTSSGASPRQITVSLTQDNSAKLATAVVNQAGAAATSGNAPYYQWGRKDPLCASVGTASTTTFKTLYNISGGIVTIQPISYGKVGNSIKNPGAFINGSSSTYDWNSITCYDTWNAVRGNTAPSSDTERYNHNKVVKSVYDPCPYGFKMPETNAFTGFTTDGKNHGSSEKSYWNVKSTTMTNNGYEFYTQGAKAEPTDFWIAGGYRSWSGGSLNYVGSNGYYWSAGSYSNTYGCYLDFNSSNVYPQYNHNRAHGFSVRPVSEQ